MSLATLSNHYYQVNPLKDNDQEFLERSKWKDNTHNSVILIHTVHNNLTNICLALSFNVYNNNSNRTKMFSVQVEQSSKENVIINFHNHL